MKEGETRSVKGTVYSVKLLPTDDPEWDGRGSKMLLIAVGDRCTSKVVFGDGAGVAVQLTDETAVRVHEKRGRYASLWTYSDEPRAIHCALGLALSEMRKRSRRDSIAHMSQKRLDEFVADFQGTLSLNRNQARRVLNSAKWRRTKGGGVAIYYESSWRRLGRTDLKDDVRTGVSWSSHEDPHHVDFYRKRVFFGARVTADAFYVVDAFSDG